MGRLSATRIKSITKPGRHADGDGLYLYVTPSGTKSWVQRITIDDRRRDLGLGSAKTVSLAKARIRAHENRVMVADGLDPRAERRRKDIPTFREAAEKTFAVLKPRWGSAVHARGWMQSLERHVMPKIGSMPVDKIEKSDILGVLEPIWTKKPETARRVRQRIKATLHWCQAHSHVEHNLAGEVIDGALPAQPKTKEHYLSLPYREVPDALREVDASEASDASKYCLRFVVLTGARSCEAREARWSEIDLANREWRVPPERMKANRAHRVPLSDGALEVLEAARSLSDNSDPDDSDLIFPSPARPGQPLSNMTLMKLLKGCGYAGRATVHGMRASFRTWAAEQTDVSREVAETALAHRVGNQVEQAYQRSDLFDRRRELMQQWSDHVGR